MPAELIDQASELEEMLREQAIAAHRIDHSAVSATHCVECGDDIPQARREAVPGCRTCSDCQQIIEIKNKQRWS
ncbi:TraR/DksA family transcriptional regulator [Pseudescherichia vulneris]|uniref:TraR/DksA family transcriptional regulator n=1 Tax=Pseudescherichia vulneris TaxID=566 RepID=UPI0028D666DB|nr:TraR/DksA family transcriptional regulator [Pseudescherichia vulneris]